MSRQVVEQMRLVMVVRLQQVVVLMRLVMALRFRLVVEKLPVERFRLVVALMRLVMPQVILAGRQCHRGPGAASLLVPTSLLTSGRSLW
jgi:hypothetical protein